MSYCIGFFISGIGGLFGGGLLFYGVRIIYWVYLWVFNCEYGGGIILFYWLFIFIYLLLLYFLL
jgi:hypothetical protein